MQTVQTRYAIDPQSAKALDTSGLREHFHVGDLFKPGQVQLTYSHYDRLVLGTVTPDNQPLVIDHVKETRTKNFLERREMGVLNLGSPAGVTVEGTTHSMDRGDILYIAMGSGPVEFHPGGRFYVLSAPAHRRCETRLIKIGDAKRVELGSKETANERVILQFLHPDVHETCQLTMGYTQFSPGSVWNTMPAHLHDRRMEAYLYFDLDADQRVFHFMGEPHETRHLVIANEQAVISPPWSIHCGSGTGAYTFCWAMAGDNTDFTDMDMVGMEQLR